MTTVATVAGPIERAILIGSSDPSRGRVNQPTPWDFSRFARERARQPFRNSPPYGLAFENCTSSSARLGSLWGVYCSRRVLIRGERPAAGAPDHDAEHDHQRHTALERGLTVAGHQGSATPSTSPPARPAAGRSSPPEVAAPEPADAEPNAEV